MRHPGTAVLPVIVVLVAAAILGATATMAHAAVSPKVFEPWESVDVVLLQPDELDEPLLLIGGTVKEGVKLPVQVGLAIPSGGEIQWAGEITGPDPTQDPTVTTRTVKGEGYDVAVFTLRKSRYGQLEVPWPTAVRDKDGIRVTSVEWVAPAKHAAVNLSLRVPADAEVTDAPTDVRRELGPDGAIQYTRAVKNVSPGQKLTLSVSFRPNVLGGGGEGGDAGQGGAGGLPSRIGGVPVWALLLLLATIALIGYVLIVQRMRANAGAGDKGDAPVPGQAEAEAEDWAEEAWAEDDDAKFDE